MTLSDLQNRRKIIPLFIAILGVLPWIAFRFESIGVSLVVLALAVATASVYVILKIREPRWKLEMEVLRSHKKHFYSNGIEYSTAIDIFLLYLFFGFCYAIAWLILSDISLLYTAGFLILIALIFRWLAIPLLRRRHLALSAEQLDLLKRERGDFVAHRFRQIVLGWRAQGRPGVSVPTHPQKNLIL
jgi:hypothetical protein